MENKQPLRICRFCGLEAWTKDELELFCKGIKGYKHGRQLVCKKCRRDIDHPKPLYLRKCIDCGLVAYNEKDLDKFAKFDKNRYGRQNLCKECLNKRNQKRRTKRPFHYIWLTKKSECKGKNIEFNLKKNFLKQLWEKQKGLCGLSNLSMFLPYSNNDWDLIGSLDRIDPHKGYTENNVRWILNCVNTFKAQQSDETVIKIAKAIAKHNP